MKTRDQKRAYDVHRIVSAVEKNPADYGRLCLALPFMIHRNGLCQTVAFLEAKNSDKKPWFGKVLLDLATVAALCDPSAFPAKVRSIQTGEYQHYTREVLSCAQWFKRYAEAVLHAEPGDRGGH